MFLVGRKNSNISHYHLVFLATALNGSNTYNLGALIARRLAARGSIYGGIVVMRIIAYLDIPVDPNDELLPPYRLDLAAMKEHKFVTTRSHAGIIVYRMLFSDGDEKEVPLPQPALFSIHRTLPKLSGSTTFWRRRYFNVVCFRRGGSKYGFCSRRFGLFDNGPCLRDVFHMFRRGFPFLGPVVQLRSTKLGSFRENVADERAI